MLDEKEKDQVNICQGLLAEDIKDEELPEVEFLKHIYHAARNLKAAPGKSRLTNDEIWVEISSRIVQHCIEIKTGQRYTMGELREIID